MILVTILIVLVIVGLLVCVHWYLWRRLVRDISAPGGRARRAGTVAVFVLPLLTFGAVTSERAGAPFGVQQALAWPGFLWLAVLLYLTLAVLVGEVVRPVLTRLLTRRAAVRASSPQAPPAVVTVPDTRAADATAPYAGAPETAAAGPGGTVGENEPRSDPATTSRRLFVARTAAIGATAAALGTVGYGTYTVMRGPTVKRITVPLAKLPVRSHGFRIAVVSDIHLGPILGRAHTQRIVETINRTNPDLIAIVGDLADGSVEDLGPAAEPLRRLRARHGSYFVTGNHEYFSGAREWVDKVRELGVHPLENARTELPGFDLAGVNDISGEGEGSRGEDLGPDYGRALGDRDPARASVLLAHQPVMIHEAVKHGVDLQLSGHTHGGQVWPGNYVAELANPTVAGMERYGDTQLYVTRGAGAWGPPVRVGAPPDVTIVELASLRA
ncbi:metallophosphoesterase [Streptomyces sp. H27-D2]|uniref:metallophosphoesterase n=1 Tax=Streptomyces sp. H27-D2 TaxID=3046304 RepID=UPI002DBBCFCE|nr:metallophosphoesterase [Streptomyces sp. H27-D2]MEC4015954.1 metallophosphoesterase [Streptomyces sp. H27-D2]